MTTSRHCGTNTAELSDHNDAGKITLSSIFTRMALLTGGGLYR